MRVYCVCAVAAMALWGCGDNGGDAEEPNAAQRRAMLVSVTDQVIVPGFETFAADAETLAADVQAWATDVAAGNAPTLATVDASFERAYRSMQYVELLQVGPYGAPSDFEGGLNIRDEVYSWPTRSACRVDQETAWTDPDDSYLQPDFVANSLVNVYGFDTLEYLLYVSDTSNACPASATLNMSGAWAALSDDAIRTRRAEYAVVVATEIARRAVEARDAWRNGFADDLKSAGTAGSRYATTQAGLDALFASMFYAERSVKDTKLAAPLGISMVCRETLCPDLVESQFAQISQVALSANLQAFADLYRGGPDSAADAIGFDDVLRDMGADDLADKLNAELTDVLAALPDVTDPMQAQLAAEEPRTLHTRLSTLMTTIKTEFVSVLALRVPNEGAADND